MTDHQDVNRRTALKLGLAGAAAGIAGRDAHAGSEASAKTETAEITRRPNILFLLVDEQRYPTVYESDALKTFRDTHLPVQQSLAKRGLTFERHYIASVACVPSRTSLYTGHYPSLHGVANTDGAAKAATDPEMHWLQPGTVPTLGNYLRAAGYRTYWKGKWHISESDLRVPGTEQVVTSYDEKGFRDPAKEDIYLQADVLEPYGFSGWVGPEPHGSDPLRSGSCAAQGQQGRDPAISEQVVRLLGELSKSDDDTPWFVMASFTNPHDIALWGFFTNLATRAQGAYDFSVPDTVPEDVFDKDLFEKTRREHLKSKPSCQQSYKEAYSQFMQPAFASQEYYRLYYRLHADVDKHLGEVMAALETSRFFEDTIVIFTSDHGDLLGSHGGMHQKWYMAYEEALRVPLVIAQPGNAKAQSVTMPTSHIDIAPTILGLAGVDAEAVRKEIAGGFTDPLPLVGRDLSPLIRGEAADGLSGPVFFMTDDDPSRGLDQKNFIGLSYDSVAQPNHVETVITEIDGEVWKYSRYFDHPRYWSNPGTPGEDGVRDVVLTLHGREKTDDGTRRRLYEQRVKTEPAPSEYELYNVTGDPMELENLAGKPEWQERETHLRQLLVEQRENKRLTPQSGPVPGEGAV
ncbi:Arylsulfatase [Candidatus Filomicrobium marinum]|uniref:Arylsulfatase n=1 Tax=Candidatus Filomicrobium marinum TaxID=1608628 RepID=A0A0D6JBF9_9HYPH|nr:sulfatase-like hydrolase/transferase [Candidatus Filomicrobium marinum]CFX04874.1 Arylsulfatase [Candidatus Filomicrobium marinum]CPR16142.1 Arylsulfatase [Candidatus Filomicrobium marinum]